MLLILLAVFALPARANDKFQGEDYFIVGNSCGIQVPQCTNEKETFLKSIKNVSQVDIQVPDLRAVRIYYMSSEFSKEFIPKVEGPVENTVLRTYQWEGAPNDIQIIKALGDRVYISLGEFYYALKNLSNKTNVEFIAYIADKNGIIRRVGFHKYFSVIQHDGEESVDEGWYITSYNLEESDSIQNSSQVYYPLLLLSH